MDSDDVCKDETEEEVEIIKTAQEQAIRYQNITQKEDLMTPELREKI